MHSDKCCGSVNNTSWHDEVTKQTRYVPDIPVQQSVWKACLWHFLPIGAKRQGSGFTMNLLSKPGPYRRVCCCCCCLSFSQKVAIALWCSIRHDDTMEWGGKNSRNTNIHWQRHITLPPEPEEWLNLLHLPRCCGAKSSKDVLWLFSISSVGLTFLLPQAWMNNINN